MNDMQNLLDRIDAETALQQARHQRLQQERLDTFEKRQRRYQELFLPALARLREIWFPRLQLLADRFDSLANGFGESIKVTPVVRPSAEEPHSAQTTFTCESSLARVCLTFSFFHDVEVQTLLIDHDLQIIPVFVRFEPHAHLEVPLENLDEDAVARWLDDRIVQFVRTYIAIHENAYYLADQMVEDPIAQVRFPRYAAQSTLQRNGVIYHFISPATQKQFESQTH